MENIVLDNIPFKVDPGFLADLMRLERGGDSYQLLEHLVGEAKSIARPKALFKLASIDAKGDDHVVLDGVTVTSRVLAVNLEDLNRAFPYVVTCGAELDKWAKSFDDTLESFLAEVVMVMGLGIAMGAMDEGIKERFDIGGNMSHQSPGSINDWPISEQRALFDILGDVHGRIGVTLLDSFFMTPRKTSSGIKFSNDTGFENCALCSNDNCPGRRTAYDPELYDREYRKR